jgi:tetratricopeptide (TPR) repeat protein
VPEDAPSIPPRELLSPSERQSVAHEAFLQYLLLDDQGQTQHALDAALTVLYYDDSDRWLFVQTAHQLRDLHRSADALALFRKSLTLAPEPDAADWEFLAGLFLDLQQLDSARTALNRAIALDSSSREALMGLALLAERDGRAPEAASQYARLALLSENPAPFSQKAYGLWMRAGHNDSILGLARALWARSTSVLDGELSAELLAREGHITEALGILDTIGRENLDEDTLRPALLTVRAELLSGRLDSARLRLRALLLAAPREADQGLIGGLLVDNDSGEAVRGLLTGLAKTEPHNPRYPDLVGSIFLARSQWDSARVWLDRSLANDSSHEGAWTRRCLLELEAERPQAAVSICSQFCARFPELGRARWLLVQALEKAATASLRSHPWQNPPPDSEPAATTLRLQALRQIDTASKLDSALPQLRFERASLLERLGHLDEAFRELQAVLAEDSTNHVAMNYLGYVMADRNRGDLSEAERLLNKALELSPKNPAYLDSRGWLRYRQGRYGEALGDIDSAMSALHDDEVVVEHHAYVLEALGRKAEARRDWMLLLQRLPGYQPAQQALQRLPVNNWRKP